jgi:hypothetical protein
LVSGLGQFIAVWVVLGILAVGPVYAAFVVFLRHAFNADALLARVERLLRIGEPEEVTKLLAALTESEHPAPAAELIARAWNMRYRVLDQASPSSVSGYRTIASSTEKPYAERLRERLEPHHVRLRRRVVWIALPTLSGLFTPGAASSLGHPTPDAARWVGWLIAVIALAAFVRAQLNERHLYRVYRRCPELFDPSLGH